MIKNGTGYAIFDTKALHFVWMNGFESDKCSAALAIFPESLVKQKQNAVDFHNKEVPSRYKIIELNIQWEEGK